PQVLRELAHAERLDPANVGKRHGGAQHAAPAQGGPARSLDLLSQILFPLDKCTAYTYTAHWVYDVHPVKAVGGDGNEGDRIPEVRLSRCSRGQGGPQTGHRA